MPKPQTVTFSIRMTTVLRASLEAEATAAGRSLNAEIVKRLADSFEHEEALRRLSEKAMGYIDSEREIAITEMNHAIALEEQLKKLQAQTDAMTQKSNDLAKRLEELERASAKPRK